MEVLEEQQEYIKFGEPAHYIKREIIIKLKLSSEDLKYSELKPGDMDGNAFNHHLKSLVNSEIVEKTDLGEYRLTAKGKREVDFYSLDSSRIKIRPISGVYLLIFSADGKILVYKNKGVPINGVEGMMFGKIRLGRSYLKTVARMLSTRNLEAQKAEALSSLNIRYSHDGELVAHRTGPLFRIELKLNASEYSDFGHSNPKICWKDVEDVSGDELLEALKLSSTESKAGISDLEIAV